MNTIEKLIGEFCPDGVEWKDLVEVCTSISAGGDLPKDFLKGKKEPTEEYPFPIYSNGTSDNALYGFTNTFKINVPAVTISARGTIGYHTVRESNFTPIVRLITLIPDSTILNVKYLDYALSITAIDSSGGSIPQLTVPSVKKISIPIPPLPIQKEIVTILDKFTALEAELEAELEARSRQYEYYRNQLLSFEDKDVEWKALGEVGEFVRGNGLPKSDFSETGVGCIHYGQIYTFYGISATETKSFVPEKVAEKLTKANKGDVVFTNTSENYEDVCKAIAWLGNEEIVIGGHACVFRHNENAKYIAYYTQTNGFSISKKKFAKGTKVIDVSAKDLAKIKIPIPSKIEQERIVTILDQFDALVNDIKVGLPAEIKARRQQYEYYRSKLLTFKNVN